MRLRRGRAPCAHCSVFAQSSAPELFISSSPSVRRLSYEDTVFRVWRRFCIIEMQEFLSFYLFVYLFIHFFFFHRRLKIVCVVSAGRCERMDQVAATLSDDHMRDCANKITLASSLNSFFFSPSLVVLLLLHLLQFVSESLFYIIFASRSPGVGWNSPLSLCTAASL